MIPDFSALAEQAVADVSASAFDSAGQRCSAARLLYAQADIAGRLIDMLAGCDGQLVIGEPARRRPGSDPTSRVSFTKIYRA